MQAKGSPQGEPFLCTLSREVRVTLTDVLKKRGWLNAAPGGSEPPPFTPSP